MKGKRDKAMQRRIHSYLEELASMYDEAGRIDERNAVCEIIRGIETSALTLDPIWWREAKAVKP